MRENFLSRPGFLLLMGEPVLTMEPAVGRAGCSIYAKHLDTSEAAKVIGAKAFIDDPYDKKTMPAALDRAEQG